MPCIYPEKAATAAAAKSSLLPRVCFLLAHLVAAGEGFPFLHPSVTGSEKEQNLSVLTLEG